MGQKINPLALRIQASNRYLDQAWYSKFFFSKLISIDLQIFNYFSHLFKLQKVPKGRYSIYHLPKTTKLYTFFCYPKYSRQYFSRIFGISSGLTNFSKPKTFSKRKLPDFSFYNEVCTHPFRVYRYPLMNQQLSIHALKEVKSSKLQFENVKQTVLNKIYNLKVQDPKLPFSTASIQKQKLTLNKSENLEIFKKIVFDFQNLQNYYKIQQNKKNEFFTKFHSVTKIHTNIETNFSQFYNFPFSLIFFRTNFEWQDAGYFADELVYLLERRISFKRIKKKLINQIVLNPNIQGIRITCSGRVGGKSKKAQRAKTDSLKYGQTSLHIFSSKIDFAVRTASTSLGSTGVKVWICYK